MKCLQIKLLVTCFAAAHVAYAGDFASEIVGCVPAPGQFINNPNYHDPVDVVGPPSGGGTAAPNNASVLSLGGFGGAVVLRFDHTVADDPGNYLGFDFIVFGNASWFSQDAQRRWAEPAHIEIMPDVNSDGLPETCAAEVWYLVPGSHTPNGTIRRAQTWDALSGGPYPPANTSWFPSVGTYPYLPEGPCVIPLDGAGRYASSAFELPPTIYSDPGSQGGTLGIIANANGADADPGNDAWESFFGYADLSPTLRLGDLNGDNVVDNFLIAAEQFYTFPDNPWRVGITPGSGGGDAFDIAEAVDPVTWQPAILTGFDFLRVTAAVDLVLGPLGEVSTEIDAAADVAPIACPGDWNADGAVDLVDLLHARNALGTEDPDPGFVIAGDTEPDGVHDLADLAHLRGAYLGTTCE